MMIHNPADIQEAVRRFMAGATFERVVTIAGGNDDGKTVYVFSIFGTWKKIIYIHDGVSLPFMSDAAPIDLVSLEDIQTAISKVTEYIGIGKKVTNISFFSAGVDVSGISNMAEVWITLMVTSESSVVDHHFQWMYTYYIHSGGIKTHDSGL